ncbi:MAG: hypothetical protein AUJ74_00520 [Candidatus Omnitrophica bacterium CG1_02_44_16]|nr:MAG: hypothetical protein AUJ74_00520 [Candidatus Omnitrophica bacterium CG1_02_44_16]PIY83329.1 MAG: hypothetical protein COY78_02700 [Candidatus Omnitrophica bacterium CG_4_10_14_0_8_um_filter_44_12]PIZ83022.1 MAG: hypothetical protein COX96_09380 [Candidatus Omnitrophica bacterium CG_4_10_14_0_2_um_filter_44_9]
MTKDLGKTTTGIQPNIAALLSYVLGFITGIIFYLIEKENKFVRFHAMQAMITFGVLFVLQIVIGFIPVINLILLPLVSIASLALWIVLMVKAYQGEQFKLPVIGDIAEKQI